MSTGTVEPELAIDVLKVIRQASPAAQVVAIEELVRLHRERHKDTDAPLFVHNAEGLVTAILIPCAKPFDPNAHTKDPDREAIIRKEMEEVIRREGPPIRLH